MEWYNGLACVTYKELTGGDPEAEKVEDRPVMSVFTYRNLTTRGDISVLRRACYGHLVQEFAVEIPGGLCRQVR